MFFGLAAVAGAFSAGRLAHLIPEGVLLAAFASMMVATAIAMLRTPSPSAKKPSELAPGELPVFRVVLEGLIVGTITGLVGAGGGFLRSSAAAAAVGSGPACA